MSNPSKKKGTAAESRVVTYLVAAGLAARRVALKGNHDEGDIHVDHPRRPIGAMFEVKAGKQTQRISRKQMEEWLAETRKEAAACGREGFLVVAKYGRSVEDYEVWSANGRRFRYLDEFVDGSTERRTA